MNFNLISNLETCSTLISQLITDNFIYYSHIPTFLVALIIGVFVFIKNRKLPSASILFFLSVVFSLWCIADLITWISTDSRLTSFVWASMYLLEGLIFVTALYFTYYFIENRISFVKNIVLVLLFLPFLVLTPSVFNVNEFNVASCEAVQGEKIYYYLYFIEILFSIWIAVILGINYRKAERGLKKQILLFGTGILLFLLAFSWANIIGTLTENWKMTQYGLFGMPVFMAFLAYLIVRYNAFNVKLVAAQALVVAIIILIGSQFAFIGNNTNKFLTGLTLILSSIGGYFLIISIKKEIKRKEMLQEISNRLSVANDKLRQMDNNKTEFISIASHQLRTPLTSIKGYASLILEGSYGEMENEGLRGAVNNIFTSTERLISLVDDLLDVSRIEAGRMQFSFAPLRIEKVCQEVIKVFSIQAGNKKLDLRLDLPNQKLPEIVTDRKRLTEAISNLVDNALKYTDEGSVCVKVRLKDDKLRVEISDTGIGVPKSEIPYLFIKFSRGKDVGRLSASGTGLGLHFVKKVIEAMSGRVWIESGGSGKGSTFIIEIPLVAKEA